MSEQQFQDLMSQYRTLNPREEFTAWSRRTILNTPRKKPTLVDLVWHQALENLKFSVALSLTSVFLLVVFGGLSYWHSLVPGASTRDLFTEAESVNQNLDIELREAKYFYGSNDDIAAILQEIGDAKKPAATPTNPHENLF